MSGRARGTAKTRPALVTVGGVIAAVAVLQVGQQVAGVFTPRPAVQIALIIAVGSAALLIERMQRDAGRRDPLLIGASVGCVGGLAAFGLLWCLGGFSSPSTPSIAEQIETIRDNAQASGLVESGYARVDLRPGAHAHLFVFDPANPGPARPSSQLRLYEEQQGSLRLQFEFQPRPSEGSYVRSGASGGLAFDRRARLPYGLPFNLVRAADVNGDGQPEILGDFEIESPQTLIVLRVPVFIRWSVTSRRYVITPVIGRSPYLGTMAGPEIPVDSRGFRTRLELRNVATPATVTGYAVSQYVVRPADQDVAVAYVRGFDREHRVLQVAAWYLPGSHTPVQECYAGRASPHVARLPLSVQLSREQLARSLPSGPQGVVDGSSCLMGE